ncbi:hypothetical protein F511_31177 [Dorcoceras hygrometricum]|uniref:Uncharacterized protein n=1 Tax=Dorcoceras hygrometricum TaxID=472368 RepID=A0A2Z7ASH0_9LAMI|nr:hypothetical protein F511_31177 [Dorcoceras hygrometricum]
MAKPVHVVPRPNVWSSLSTPNGYKNVRLEEGFQIRVPSLKSNRSISRNREGKISVNINATVKVNPAQILARYRLGLHYIVSAQGVQATHHQFATNIVPPNDVARKSTSGATRKLTRSDLITYTTACSYPAQHRVKDQISLPAQEPHTTSTQATNQPANAQTQTRLRTPSISEPSISSAQTSKLIRACTRQQVTPATYHAHGSLRLQWYQIRSDLLTVIQLEQGNSACARQPDLIISSLARCSTQQA